MIIFLGTKNSSSALQCVLTSYIGASWFSPTPDYQFTNQNKPRTARWDFNVNYRRFDRLTIFYLVRLASRNQISMISINGAIVWQRISSTIKRITLRWEFCCLHCLFYSIRGKRFWDWRPSEWFAHHLLSSIRVRCKDNRNKSNSPVQLVGSIWLALERPCSLFCIYCSHCFSWDSSFCCHSVWHSFTHRSDWETWKINYRMQSTNDYDTHPWACFWRRWALAWRHWRNRRRSESTIVVSDELLILM